MLWKLLVEYLRPHRQLLAAVDPFDGNRFARHTGHLVQLGYGEFGDGLARGAKHAP